MATAHFEEAIGLFGTQQKTHPAARVSARLAEILWDQGHIEQGLERMEASFAVLAGEEPDEDLATLAAQLARLHVFAGDLDRGAERVELALEIAESLRLAEVISQALNTKHLILADRGRLEEAAALLKHALQVAPEGDVPTALRAYNNLLVLGFATDRLEPALAYAVEGVVLARKRGDRFWEWSLLGMCVECLWRMGAWDDDVSVAGEPVPNEIPHLKGRGT